MPTFTAEQIDMLDELGIDSESLTLVERSETNRLGRTSVRHAWADDDQLVFQDEQPANEEKALYFMGCERRAVLVARFRGLSVWEGATLSDLAA